MGRSSRFEDVLDWTLEGKKARVASKTGTYLGWIDRVHHGRGSVIMHDCQEVSGDAAVPVGSVFIRTPSEVVVMQPRKRIEYREISNLSPYPDHPQDFEPKDHIMRNCYRNQFAGGFPVVRESDGTIINGHKRIEAARRVGLDRHPVEVVSVTDEQAQELYELAHRDLTSSDDSSSDEQAGNKSEGQEQEASA